MKKLRHLSLCCTILLLFSISCGQPKTQNKPNYPSQNNQPAEPKTPQDKPQESNTDTASDHDSGSDADTDNGQHDPPPDNTDQATDTPAKISLAEEWARARLAGKVSTAEAFRVISRNGGFPVKSSADTLIFMHWYEGGNWSVAGDFNNWKPQPMNRIGDLWYLEIPIPEAGKSGYKFVNDNTYSADPFAAYYDFDENGEISLLAAPVNQAYHQRWTMISGPKGLIERTIQAYVPAGNGPFPVIYAHDGQNLFHDGWKIETALEQIQAPIVVVGINNTTDRMLEYTHVSDTAFGTYYPSKGRDYASFVNGTVRPMIEKSLPVSSKRGLMGSSLGGLISLYIAYLYPGEYDMVLALSPTTAWGRLGSNTGTTIEDLYKNAGHQNTVLYLDNGGSEPDGGCGFLDQAAANLDESNNADDLDNYCYTRHFVDTMANEVGYTWETDLFHWHEPGALHNEAAWAARVAQPLKIFMQL